MSSPKKSRPNRARDRSKKTETSPESREPADVEIALQNLVGLFDQHVPLATSVQRFGIVKRRLSQFVTGSSFPSEDEVLALSQKGLVRPADVLDFVVRAVSKRRERVLARLSFRS